MTSALTLWSGAWIRGQQGPQFAMPSANGARFPTGSTWATMPTAGSSSWVSHLTSATEGQGCACVRRPSYILKLCDPTLDNDGEPSCSAVEALERQEPFVNSTLAQHALALLARLFRYGEISYHGGFINLATGATSVLRIDPAVLETKPQSKQAQFAVTSKLVKRPACLSAHPATLRGVGETNTHPPPGRVYRCSTVLREPAFQPPAKLE